MLHELHAWKRTWLCVCLYFHLKDALKTVQYMALNVSSYHWMFETSLDSNRMPYTTKGWKLHSFVTIYAHTHHTHRHLVHTGFFHPPKPIQCPPESNKQHTQRYLHRARVFNSVLIWSFSFADRNSNLIDKFSVCSK